MLRALRVQAHVGSLDTRSSLDTGSPTATALLTPAKCSIRAESAAKTSVNDLSNAEVDQIAYTLAQRSGLFFCRLYFSTFAMGC